MPFPLYSLYTIDYYHWHAHSTPFVRNQKPQNWRDWGLRHPRSVFSLPAASVSLYILGLLAVSSSLASVSAPLLSSPCSTPPYQPSLRVGIWAVHSFPSPIGGEPITLGILLPPSGGPGKSRVGHPHPLQGTSIHRIFSIIYF